MSGKWLELLKEIAPGVTRVAVLRDPAIPGPGQFAAIQAVAPSVGMEVTPVNVRDAGEIERAVTAFAHTSRDGLIVTASALTVVSSRSDRRAGGPAQAARGLCPAPSLSPVGGLISYGPDVGRPVPARGRLRRPHSQGREACRSAGAEPTKYELVINLKTAKALGLDSAADAARPRRRGDRMMSGASSSRCSAARRRRGRSRRARSRRRCR